nr:hypothetical protein [Tanacetum cinerariifolium]
QFNTRKTLNSYCYIERGSIGVKETRKTEEVGPVLEEFIPLKKKHDEDEDEGVDLIRKENGDKMNWFNFTQLWKLGENSLSIIKWLKSDSLDQITKRQCDVFDKSSVYLWAYSSSFRWIQRVETQRGCWEENRTLGLKPSGGEHLANQVAGRWKILLGQPRYCVNKKDPCVGGGYNVVLVVDGEIITKASEVVVVMMEILTLEPHNFKFLELQDARDRILSRLDATEAGPPVCIEEALFQASFNNVISFPSAVTTSLV